MSAKLKQPAALNLLCAVLCLLLLVMQFTPFWQTEELSCSISGYVWFPNDHKDVDAYLAEQHGEGYSINQILIPTILTLVLSAFGAVLCVTMRSRPVMLAIPCVCGLVGVWGFLSQPVLRLGGSWMLQLLLCLAMLLLSAYGLYGLWRSLSAPRTA